MGNYKLKDHCKINTNKNSDTFVGLQCMDGELFFNFPMGFPELEDDCDDDEYRKNIILVLDSIANTVNRRESELLRDRGSFFVDSFPLHAYFFLVADFIEHGYYKETDVFYRKSKRGKINWRKTINNINPCFQDGSFIYLDFITKRTSINEDELITSIHKYCVYESFERIGWLFTSNLPERPNIKFNHDLFKTIVTDRLNQTFNDEKRQLFINMLAVIERDRDTDSTKNYMYGTTRYEYVWEKMIDKVFGIPDKERFFPRTYWKTKEGIHNNACLEPDTIMIYGKNVYILDAKYYKYGTTNEPEDLPESTSINKQITYGEFVATSSEIKKQLEPGFITYNAFLMPYSSEEKTYLNCGIAYSDWKAGNEPYENVVGVLVDLKHLIVLAKTGNKTEIPSLASVIMNAFI